MKEFPFRHALLSVLAASLTWVASCATTSSPPPPDANLEVDGPKKNKKDPAAAPQDDGGNTALNGLNDASSPGDTPADGEAGGNPSADDPSVPSNAGGSPNGADKPSNMANTPSEMPSNTPSNVPSNMASNVPTNKPANAPANVPSNGAGNSPQNPGLGGGANDFNPNGSKVPANGALPANGAPPANGTLPANGAPPASANAAPVGNGQPKNASQPPANVPANPIQAEAVPSQAALPVPGNTPTPGAGNSVPANVPSPPPANALPVSANETPAQAAVPVVPAVEGDAPATSAPAESQPAKAAPQPLSPEDLSAWRTAAAKLHPLAPDEGPGEYVVQPGDTLWDISDQLLDDPNWWPKLWVLNPQVENPHLIYPGMKLVFHSSDGTTAPVIAAKDLGEAYPIGADSKSITRFPSADGHPWAGKEGILLDPRELGNDANFDFGGGVPLPGSFLIQVPAFLSANEPAAVGEVLSAGERAPFSVGGGVTYAKFDQAPRPGEKFLAIRKTPRGSDPNGDVRRGPDMYLYTGIVGVLKTHGSGKVSLLVEESRQGVAAGDTLIPYKNINQQLDLRSAGRTSNVKAEVLGVPGAGLGMAVAGQFIVLDRGEGAVSVGDDIDLFMPAGGVVYFKDDDLDPVLVGRARVVDVGEGGIVAFIVSSTREVSVGARTWASF